MAYNFDWKNNENLKTDLDKDVRENLKKCEILDFVKRDYPDYPWSMATLSRRLSHFGIRYINYETPLQDVTEAVSKELEGPGRCLGYRALNQKLRTQHNIKVPRHLVYNVLTDMDPEGLEARGVNKKIKKRKVPFSSEGPLWLVSLDGHDKLCGYQNWTFPLCIYGCLDTFSRKILYLFVSHSNSDPMIVGKKYLEYLTEHRIIPRFLRLDKGTETGKMSTLHAFLVDKAEIMDDAVDSIIYGPSTSNKIERWWRDLHERFERYFKEHLAYLLQQRYYDPHNAHHRQLMTYVFTPVIQRECDSFVSNWNTHRIREQKNLLLPTGIPNHMFSFPEQYGGMQCGIPISSDHLREAAEVSGLLDSVERNIDLRVTRECERLLPTPDKLESNKVTEAYIYLKQSLQL